MHLLPLFLLFALHPFGVDAAAPPGLRQIAVDFGCQAPAEGYLKGPPEAGPAPAWFDLRRFPFPTPSPRPAVTSVPGQAPVKVPGPNRRFQWGRIPGYALLGFPCDVVDLGIGLGDRVPIVGLFVYACYFDLPVNHLFRHPDDWYECYIDNKNGHGGTAGLLWSTENGPGFFSNWRCTKWETVDDSPVRKAKEHNRRVDEAIAKANRDIAEENRVLADLPRLFVAAIEPAFQEGRSEEAFTRYKSFRTACPDVAKVATPQQMLRLRSVAAASLARLGAKDAPHAAWYRSEMYALDKDLLGSLPKAFDDQNLRGASLVLLAQWRGVYGNDLKEALSVFDQVAAEYEKAGRVRERAEMIRWVYLPTVLVSAVRGAPNADADRSFAAGAVDAVQAAGKIAQADPQYGEEFRAEALDVLQAWTFYSVAKSKQELEKNLGFRIIDRLKDHTDVACRQQARELLSELRKDCGKVDARDAQTRLWGKLMP